MKLSKEKIQAYIDKKGVICPFCGSNQLQGGFVETRSGTAYQKITCLDCEESWTDGYKLVNIALE